MRHGRRFAAQSCPCSQPSSARPSGRRGPRRPVPRRPATALLRALATTGRPAGSSRSTRTGKWSLARPGQRRVHHVVVDHLDRAGRRRARRCGAAGSRTSMCAGRPGPAPTAASVSPSATVRQAAPSGVLVQVGAEDHRQRRTSASSRLSRAAWAGPFGRVGGQVRAGHHEPGAPPTLHRRTRRRAGAGPGVSGNAQQRVPRPDPQAGQHQVAQRGQAAGGDHQAERAASVGGLVPPPEPARRLLHDHHVRGGRADHRGQRGQVVRAGRGRCTTDARRSGRHAPVRLAGRRRRRSLGRHRRRARSAAPTDAGRVAQLGRATSATGSRPRCASASAKAAGSGRAAGHRPPPRRRRRPAPAGRGSATMSARPLPSQRPTCGERLGRDRVAGLRGLRSPSGR